MNPFSRISLQAPREFIASRLLFRYRSLWRVMQYIAHHRKRVVAANLMLFLATTIFSLVLVSMAPFLNHLFSEWKAEGQPPAQERRIEAAPAEAEPVPAERLREVSPGLGGALDSLRESGQAAFDWMKADLRRFLLCFTAIILVLLVLAGLLQFLGDLILARVGIDVTSSILRRLYANVLKQEMAFFDNHSSGELIDLCYRQVFQIQTMVKLLASNRPLLPLKMAVLFVALLVISLQLTLLLLVLMPVVIVPTMLLTRQLKRSLKSEIESESGPVEVMSQAFQGILAIKAFGAERLEERYMRPSVDWYVDLTTRRRRAEAMVGPVVDLLNTFVMIAVFVVAFLFFGESLALNEGELVAFMMAINRFYKPFRSLMTMGIRMQRADIVAGRVFGLMDRRCEVVQDPRPTDFPEDWPAIRFREVDFAYRVRREGRKSRRPVLSGAEWRVNRGEHVALLGPNGSGKSSVAKLLCRLYDPDKGRIQIGGGDIRYMKLDALRRRVCLITQYPVLFDRSVAENIAFGLEEADAGAIEAAARAAGCDGFVRELPQGYQTRIGEGGRLLSGGQRQKIALARAFLRRPDILILDEPTTGLDHESKRDFLDRIDALRDSDLTVIHITHDRRGLDRFDRLFEIRERRIERVTRRELRDKGPAA